MDWRGDQIWDKVGVRVYEAGFSCLACTRCLKYKLLGFREGRKEGCGSESLTYYGPSPSRYFGQVKYYSSKQVKQRLLEENPERIL